LRSFQSAIRNPKSAIMRILGIDPGLERTGYGVVELAAGVGAPRLVEAGVIRTARTDTLPQRLAEIQAGLASVIEEFKPEAMAVEELYSHYGHPRTAILMGHARGVALLAAAQAGVPVTSYGATHIKKALVGRSPRNRPTWPTPWPSPSATRIERRGRPWRGSTASQGVASTDSVMYVNRKERPPRRVNCERKGQRLLFLKRTSLAFLCALCVLCG
jgi:crossover junction endodeoxyribonuclease RuvC